ncbi:MAG: hypothetical protein ACK5XN_28935 [Bacteroidota bacterium]
MNDKTSTMHTNTPKSEVYNMDCLDAMREMPDKAFDLAIVDPPYGIGASSMNMGIGKSKRPQRQKTESGASEVGMIVSRQMNTLNSYSGCLKTK